MAQFWPQIRVKRKKIFWLPYMACLGLTLFFCRVVFFDGFQSFSVNFNNWQQKAWNN